MIIHSSHSILTGSFLSSLSSSVSPDLQVFNTVASTINNNKFKDFSETFKQLGNFQGIFRPPWKKKSFHLRCQRRILGIKWSNFITNAEVYTRSGLQSIQSIVCRCRLSLFGHVARMPDNVPAKAVLCMACDVRDGVPPFPTGADHGVVLPSPGCTRIMLSAGDALNCAQDRAVWRTYATASSASRWRRQVKLWMDLSSDQRTRGN